MKPKEALEKVMAVRYELALAIATAPASSPMRAHISWHAFQPWFGEGDPTRWAYEMEYILYPRLLADPAWATVGHALEKLLVMLKSLDHAHYSNCNLCT